MSSAQVLLEGNWMHFFDGHLFTSTGFPGVRLELAKWACLIAPYFKSKRNCEAFAVGVWEMSAQTALSRASSEDDYYKTSLVKPQSYHSQLETNTRTWNCSICWYIFCKQMANLEARFGFGLFKTSSAASSLHANSLLFACLSMLAQSCLIKSSSVCPSWDSLHWDTCAVTHRSAETQSQCHRVPSLREAKQQ